MTRCTVNRAAFAAIVLLALATAPQAQAIDLIILEADAVETPAIRAADLAVQLAIESAEHTDLSLTLARVDLAGAGNARLARRSGGATQLKLRCRDPLMREPRFECAQLQFSLRSDRFGAQSLRTRVAFDSARGALQFAGSGLRVAGSKLSFDGNYAASGWRVKAAAATLSLIELQKLVEPWWSAPQGLTADGSLAVSAELHGAATLERARIAAQLRGFNLQNAAATLVSEKLGLDFAADAAGSLAKLRASLELRGTGGQMLAGPVLLDFKANPLTLTAAARWQDGVLELSQVALAQRDLSRVSGSVTLQTSPTWILRRATLELQELKFPAAYASYLQLPLATTDFGSLTSTGSARGSLEIADNMPMRADLILDALGAEDAAKQIRLAGLAGEVHWNRGAATPPAASWLRWTQMRAFGLEGGATRVDFLTRDSDLEFTQPARLPLFDGAVLIHTLVARNIGSENDLQGAFDATIEPISIGRISKALGGPEFAGQLAGRIPGLTYRDKLATFQGNVEANVFDGRIVASNLRVRDPLGKWPRLYADITARNLDLGLLTGTFEFGGITGRIDGDVKGLETFDWQPIAFDARLATPAGDRSRHRISQKAVQNLSNIGGGGGGVAAALQGGLLRFFETFHYDRIGLSCRLANDICQMNGVEPAKSGYYIVKGSGLPRIDIIGNSHRVDWPLLMAQIKTAASNTDDIVVK